MLKFSGEKLNLSSGMASAASTICFSIALISASMAEATVGCACCAPGAFVAEVLFSLGLKAVTPKMSNPSGKKIRICFIRVTPFDLFWPKNLWRPSELVLGQLVLWRRANKVDTAGREKFRSTTIARGDEDGPDH